MTNNSNNLYAALKHLKNKLAYDENVKNVIYVNDNDALNNKYRTHVNSVSFDSQAAFDSICTNIRMLDDANIDYSMEMKNTKAVFESIKNVRIYICDRKQRDEVVSTVEGKILLIKTSSMLSIFCVTCREKRMISTLINDDLSLKKEPINQTFYRGHTNVNYRLIPSIYRNIKVKDDFDIVTNNTLRSLYDEANLIEKYRKVFNTDEIDYNFCAFAQHSCAYSPLLDFSEEIKVALSFATNSSGAINDYLNNEVALYSISFNKDLEEVEHISLSDICVLINNHKLNALSLIGQCVLYASTWENFGVEACIIKDKTNDRMKYQKGCFLYFRKAIIVNGYLLMPLNFGRIRKYVIPTDGNTVTKTGIARTIDEKYKWYRCDYMMNPYKYFEESPL